MYKTKSIKVFWNDAVIYKDRVPLKLPPKITEGELVKKTDNYLIIKNPQTSIYSDADRIYIPRIEPKHKFFFIPKGMIKKIKYESHT